MLPVMQVVSKTQFVLASAKTDMYSLQPVSDRLYLNNPDRTSTIRICSETGELTTEMTDNADLPRMSGDSISNDTIRFFFDYISPYAYLAWTQLPRLVRTFGVTIEPVPVLFAGLLEAHGNVGPAEIPAKRAWMIENVLQTATLLEVPIRPPAFHPFNPLLALRITVSSRSDSEQAQIIDACFRGAWQESIHISEPDVLQSLLDESGIDAASVVQRGMSTSAKDLLRQNTNDAIAAGVFGVPSFIFNGQLFWGISDLAIIEARLGGKETLDREVSKSWKKSVRTSAERKGQ